MNDNRFERRISLKVGVLTECSKEEECIPFESCQLSERTNLSASPRLLPDKHTNLLIREGIFYQFFPLFRKFYRLNIKDVQRESAAA